MGMGWGDKSYGMAKAYDMTLDWAFGVVFSVIDLYCSFCFPLK